MANLSSSSTGHKNSFEKYVTKNPMWNKTLEFEVDSGVEDEPLFSSKGKSILTLSAGDKLTIVDKHTRKMKLGDQRSNTYARVKVGKAQGFFRINRIHKPSGRANVMIKEELARKNLSEAITTIGHPITVKVKRTNSGGYYTFDKVVSTDTVEGTPKADFALVNTKGNHVCWISHKAAGDASSFQQYSGISSKSGKRIYENDEVQSFMRRVIPYIKNDKLQKPIMSSINSSTLVSYAVYGPDFGKEFGEDNCHLIGQGTPKLTRHRTKDDCYYLTWENGHHTNGDVVGLRGGYEPYFAATYRSGRGFFVDGERYVGARLGIVPKSFIHRRLHVVDV